MGEINDESELVVKMRLWYQAHWADMDEWLPVWCNWAKQSGSFYLAREPIINHPLLDEGGWVVRALTAEGALMVIEPRLETVT